VVRVRELGRYSQDTQIGNLCAGEDTGRDARSRGWNWARGGIGGRRGGIRRVLGVNSAGEESSESELLDKHHILVGDDG
jgi:hypothetical protein